MKISKRFTRWFGGSVSAQEKRLLHHCRGDRELAERLIGLELARRPDLSRPAASARAVDRWQHTR